MLPTANVLQTQQNREGCQLGHVGQANLRNAGGSRWRADDKTGAGWPTNQRGTEPMGTGIGHGASPRWFANTAKRYETGMLIKVDQTCSAGKTRQTLQNRGVDRTRSMLINVDHHPHEKMRITWSGVDSPNSRSVARTETRMGGCFLGGAPAITNWCCRMRTLARKPDHFSEMFSYR